MGLTDRFKEIKTKAQDTVAEHSDQIHDAVGKAAGINSTMRELGGVFGIALLVAVFSEAGSYASPQAFSVLAYDDGQPVGLVRLEADRIGDDPLGVRDRRAQGPRSP